jgi:hypothetical protein
MNDATKIPQTKCAAMLTPGCIRQDDHTGLECYVVCEYEPVILSKPPITDDRLREVADELFSGLNPYGEGDMGKDELIAILRKLIEEARQ